MLQNIDYNRPLSTTITIELEKFISAPENRGIVDDLIFRVMPYKYSSIFEFLDENRSPDMKDIEKIFLRLLDMGDKYEGKASKGLATKTFELSRRWNSVVSEIRMEYHILQYKNFDCSIILD